MQDYGLLIDRCTQLWVRSTGRRVSFDECAWLLGPVGGTHLIADDWVDREAERIGGHLSTGGGIIADIRELTGEGFDPSLLARPVVDFYESTAFWRMEVWTQWSSAAWPIGRLLASLFTSRLQQLGLPFRPLDTARGLDSHVVIATDSAGRQLGAAWQRTLRATGQTLYSGWYGIEQPPRASRPNIRVVFPLPNGSAMVFLRPEVGPDGALILESPRGEWGDVGAYVVVINGDEGRGWARRVPLVERLVVWVDEEGVLRTDHSIDFRQLPLVRLHYRMDRRFKAS